MSSFKIFVTIALALVFFACTKDKGRVPIQETECNIPAATSYTRDIQPIFDKYCLGSGCHSGNNPPGNLGLEAAVSYADITKPNSGYTDTLNPKYSLLYNQMNSSSNPMPPSGKLDKCKTDLVLKWIEQKTKNN